MSIISAKATNWSPQQTDVFDWVTDDTGSLNLVARAGCGKTTTLLGVVGTIIDHGMGGIFLGAYNKAIAAELKVKLSDMGVDWKQAEANTMHAIGFRLWRQANPSVVMKDDKVASICGTLYEADSKEADFIKYHTGAIKRAVSLAKQSGFGFSQPVEDTSAWFALLEHHDLDDFENDEKGQAMLVAISIQVLLESLRQDPTCIDFDDMLLAPLAHNVRIKYPYKWVLLDESQDTNVMRRALALKLMKPIYGRLIAVGDDRQAIYGFTGADSDAMDLIKAELGSKVLPLNVTYRCPKAVVAEAQKYVPDIEAHESAPEGAVEHRHLGVNIQASDFKPNDVILCRNTAPLIEMAYNFIRQQIPCKVEGRDIGLGLMKLISQWNVKTLVTLSRKLEDYLEKETGKWLARGKEVRAAQVDDQVRALQALVDCCQQQGKQRVDDVLELIGSMFGDSYLSPNSGAGEYSKPPMLTLSTIHKSKGREWERVFLLDADRLMPSPYARKGWQRKQEENLAYVAITRAKHTLVYLTGGVTKKQQQQAS